MTYREILSHISVNIKKNDAYALLMDFLKKDRAGLLCLLSENVPEANIESFMELVDKRVTGMPVAYITGVKEFYSLDFYVNQGVLIPRPESELLVDYVLKEATGKRILDLCCGSGCIGISIAANCKCTLTLADISKDALNVARSNSKKHKINAEFIETDIMKDQILGQFDIILSNPPYIETNVIKTLETDVKDFEPIIALDGGGDGLAFYPMIVKKAYTALKIGGKLYVEIGYNQGNAVRKIFEEYFNNVKIIKDLSLKDRMICGMK